MRAIIERLRHAAGTVFQIPLTVLTSALLGIWVAFPWLHVFERWVQKKPSPVLDGISGRLDDPSYWHITGLIGAVIALAFAVRASRRRFGEPPPRITLERIPCDLRFVGELLLAGQVVSYLGYGLATRNNLWRWLKPGTPLLEDVKQMLEGVLCLGFIFLGYAAFRCVDRLTRYLWQLRKDPAYQTRIRDLRLFLEIALFLFPALVMTLGYGLYIFGFGPSLAAAVPGWREPKVFDFSQTSPVIAAFLFFAGLSLYLFTIMLAALLAKCRLS